MTYPNYSSDNAQVGYTVKLQFIMLKKFGLRQHCLNIECKGTRSTEARLNSNYTSTGDLDTAI